MPSVALQVKTAREQVETYAPLPTPPIRRDRPARAKLAKKRTASLSEALSSEEDEESSSLLTSESQPVSSVSYFQPSTCEEGQPTQPTPEDDGGQECGEEDSYEENGGDVVADDEEDGVADDEEDGDYVEEDDFNEDYTQIHPLADNNEDLDVENGSSAAGASGDEDAEDFRNPHFSENDEDDMNEEDEENDAEGETENQVNGEEIEQEAERGDEEIRTEHEETTGKTLEEGGSNLGEGNMNGEVKVTEKDKSGTVSDAEEVHVDVAHAGSSSDNMGTPSHTHQPQCLQTRPHPAPSSAPTPPPVPPPAPQHHHTPADSASVSATGALVMQAMDAEVRHSILPENTLSDVSGSAAQASIATPSSADSAAEVHLLNLDAAWSQSRGPVPPPPPPLPYSATNDPYFWNCVFSYVPQVLNDPKTQYGDVRNYAQTHHAWLDQGCK